MDKTHTLRIGVVITILILFFAGLSDAATLIVNASGGTDYTKIQDAINNASTGDTILVQSGTYFENVNVSKQLNMQGVDTGYGKPVVNSGCGLIAIKLSANGNTLKGFVATNAGEYGKGIYVVSKNNTITDNVVRFNGGGFCGGDPRNYGEGMEVRNSNNTISNNNVYSNGDWGIIFAGPAGYEGGNPYNNTVINNTVSNNDAGVLLWDFDNGRFDGNYIHNNNNPGTAAGGINLLSSSNAIIINNKVESNYEYGISIRSTNNNNITNNTISYNNKGIYIEGSGNNNIYNNLFKNFQNYVFGGSVYNNTWNMVKQEGTNVVGGSYIGGNLWDNPYNTGFSQTCADAEKDGICDSAYVLNVNNTDYLPLAVPDTTPPIIGIISPQNRLYNITIISLKVSANEVISTWLYSLNGAPNVSFIPNTTITAIEGSNNLIVYANDIAGNWNTSLVDFSVDTTPPVNVTNLRNITYASTYINWTWTDPSDIDFDYVEVYLDGIQKLNVLAGVQYYNATELTASTTHEISTRTVDMAGNINGTWVNHTAVTASMNSGPRTITVNASGGGDYTRIQDAVNAANNGDTITVAAGTYNENVDVNKSVSLIGAGAEVTIVNASNPMKHVFNVTENFVNINGFTVMGASSLYEAGICLYSSNNNITGNYILNNNAGFIFKSSSRYNNLIGNNVSNNYDGIGLYSNNDDNNISNNIVSNNGDGIKVFSSSNYNIFIGNTINNNIFGIDIQASGGNTFKNNTIFENIDTNLFINGIMSDFSQNIDTSNKINGKPIYYWVNKHNLEIPNDAGYVGVISSTNITVSDLKIIKNSPGVLFSNTSNSRIINVSFSNNSYAILLQSSHNNTINNNTAINNEIGVVLNLGSENNSIYNNSFQKNNNGIYVDNICNNNNIKNNIIDLNDIGIYTRFSNNLIYNNFFNNTVNVYFGNNHTNLFNKTKIFDHNIINGPYIGGNFWANPSGTGFSQSCTDVNKDGICDMNYVLASENIDYLPLVAYLVPMGYGYISGTVLNGTGIPDSLVTTNTGNSTNTDASGIYALLVPAGEYNLTVIKEPEFYSNTSVIVTAISGTTVTQDIELLRKQTGNINGSVMS